MRVFNKILYFVITVIVLSSMGVWLPFALDYFKGDSISIETKQALAGNILTYYLSLFFIAVIDRILHISKDERYKHKITEILIMSLVILVCISLTYISFRSVAHKLYDKAAYYACIATAVSYIIWWIANWKNDNVDPYSSLGGKI